MATNRHKLFNFFIILMPWLSLLFIGKRSMNRYSIAGAFIVLFEIINHLYGHKKKWWKFYDKRRSFVRDELPFDICPYMPMSLWILKYSYGNLKKYALMNAIANGIFTFIGMPILKKMKIIRLYRLNYLQFFIYIHYKSYVLYGFQYLYEKIKNK
ncbi:hypothetical protein [Niallia hominis]|uniref:Uncharacterized protein n=1 Tax=Niallia hominis TaxID=3133173 RepID=A0ABV1EYD6_9BACI